jgi:hypothetical protein
MSKSDKKMAPVLHRQATARGPAQREALVDVPKSSPPHPTLDTPTRLAKLEEKYRHELLPKDDRLELQEAIGRLRCKLVLSLPCSWHQRLFKRPKTRPFGRHVLVRVVSACRAATVSTELFVFRHGRKRHTTVRVCTDAHGSLVGNQQVEL